MESPSKQCPLVSVTLFSVFYLDNHPIFVNFSLLIRSQNLFLGHFHAPLMRIEITIHFYKVIGIIIKKHANLFTQHFCTFPPEVHCTYNSKAVELVSNKSFILK